MKRGQLRTVRIALVMGLAFLGQLYLVKVQPGHTMVDGFVLFGAAIALFLLLVEGQEASAAGAGVGVPWYRRAVSAVREAPIRAALLLLSFALTYTVVRALMAGPGMFGSYWGIFALWVTGVVCYVLAFARRGGVIPSDPTGGVTPPLRSGSSRLPWLREHRVDVVAIVLLTASAAVLRLVALGRIPDVVYVDEGQIGLLARSVLSGELKNMFATTYGHSTLYLFIMAGVMKLLGINAATLRLTSAIAGALTVAAVYILARDLFNRRVALVAAALLSVSHIHLHFSRVIIAGGIQDALFATVGLYLFVSGLERRNRTRLVLSAVTVGLHVYIYMGARLVILLLPLYLLALLIVNPDLVRQNASGLLAFVGGLIVTLAPMAVWATGHPAEFMARVNQMGIIQTGWLANEAKNLGQSQLHVLMNLGLQAFLTVNAHPASAFYGSPLPMLDFLAAAFFMLGLAYSLYHTTSHRYLLLNAWFWAGIVAGGALVLFPTLAAYRILIVLPAVCILVGLGWDRLIEWGSSGMQYRALSAGALTAVFIGLLATLNLKAYFGDFAHSCRYGTWEMRFASRMGEALRVAGPEYTGYLLGFPRIQYDPAVYPSVGFLTGAAAIRDIREPWADRLNFQAEGQDRGGKALFFFSPDRENEVSLLMQQIPGGKVEHIYDCQSPLMTVYRTE